MAIKLATTSQEKVFIHALLSLQQMLICLMGYPGHGVAPKGTALEFTITAIAELSRLLGGTNRGGVVRRRWFPAGSNCGYRRWNSCGKRPPPARPAGPGVNGERRPMARLTIDSTTAVEMR